jgi:hypothetical protein
MTVPRDADALRIFVRLAPRVEAAADRALTPVFDLKASRREQLIRAVV